MNIEKNYPSQLGTHNRGVIDNSLNKRIKKNNLVTEPDNVKTPLIRRQPDKNVEVRVNYAQSHLSNGSGKSGGQIKSLNYLRNSVNFKQKKDTFPCSQEHSIEREDFVAAPVKYSTALHSK